MEALEGLVGYMATHVRKKGPYGPLNASNHDVCCSSHSLRHLIACLDHFQNLVVRGLVIGANSAVCVDGHCWFPFDSLKFTGSSPPCQPFDRLLYTLPP